MLLPIWIEYKKLVDEKLFKFVSIFWCQARQSLSSNVNFNIGLVIIIFQLDIFEKVFNICKSENEIKSLLLYKYYYY